MASLKNISTEPLSNYFANELINHFRLTGTIVALDRRKSGATVITLQAGSLADAPVEGTDSTRLFTSRFLVRVPPRLKAKWPDNLLRQSPSIVTVTGRLHGVIEMIDGREYLLQEMVAHDIQFIARFGTVATHPIHWIKPFEDAEGKHDPKPEAAASDDKAAPSAAEPASVSANPASREAS